MITVRSRNGCEYCKGRQVEERKESARLPVLIACAVVGDTARLAVDLENVLSSPGLRCGFVLVGAHAPVVRIGHGIERDLPQKLDVFAGLANKLNALNQSVQRLRISLGIRWYFDLTEI